MSSRTRSKGVTRIRGGTMPRTRPRRGPPHRLPRTSRRLVRIALGGAVVVGLLFGVWYFGGGADRPQEMTHGEPLAQTGEPGVGAEAPPVTLRSAQGETFDLAFMRGSTVLLFFHEGLMCPPCFDQIADIEAAWERVRALGIDAMASISHDSLDNLKQVVQQGGFSTPLLSDPDLAASLPYDAPTYGMHPGQTNGHTFVAVGPDGRIRWRADYGGPPTYTMYVPLEQLLTDLRQGLGS